MNWMMIGNRLKLWLFIAQYHPLLHSPTMYSLKALSRVRVLAQSHYNDPIHLPLAEHTRIPTFFVSKEIQRCLVSTYKFSNRLYVHHTVVPFITVWALICFLPEICRNILSVKMLFLWLTAISPASDNWACKDSIFSIFSLFSSQCFVALRIHYTTI